MTTNFNRIYRALDAAKNVATLRGKNRIEEIMIYSGYS